MKELTHAWNTEKMTAIRGVERRLLAFQGTRLKQGAENECGKQRNVGLRKTVLSFIGNNRPCKMSKIRNGSEH